MTFDPIDTGPEGARAALAHSRQILCARVAALQAQPDEAFIDAYPTVVAAVEIGFRHEEMLLDRIGGTCLRTRRADDAVILCALHRVMPCIERGDIALGRQVAAALGAVLSLRPAPDRHGAPALAANSADPDDPVDAHRTGAGGSWRTRARAPRRPVLHAVRLRPSPRLP